MNYQDYIASYNAGDDEATYDAFYAEDLILEAPQLQVLRGRAEVLGFLKRGHDGIRERLEPIRVLEGPGVILAELNATFTAERDIVEHSFGPLEAGQSRTLRCFASYTIEDDRIKEFRLAFWPPND